MYGVTMVHVVCRLGVSNMHVINHILSAASEMLSNVQLNALTKSLTAQDAI